MVGPPGDVPHSQTEHARESRRAIFLRAVLSPRARRSGRDDVGLCIVEPVDGLIVVARLRDHPEVKGIRGELEREVLDGELTPALAADRILDAFGS